MKNEDFGKQIMFYLEHIAPKIGVYHQTVYLFLLGESFRSGSEEVTLSMKKDRLKMGKGIGDGEKPMSENSLSITIQKLCQVELLEKIDSGRFGTRVRVKNPLDAINFHVEPVEDFPRSIEEIDFFEESIARKSILEREKHKCFYCAKSLTYANYVIEHVVSRPAGTNSYRNLVASCQVCNNRKSERKADDFVRTLYRDCLLNETELKEVIEKLEKLKNGLLVPTIVDPPLLKIE